MNLRKLIPALCVAGALMGAAAPAGAYPYGDHWRDRGTYHDGWRHDRGWHEGWRHSGWRDDRGWRGGYHRNCWWERRHHHRVRFCR